MGDHLLRNALIYDGTGAPPIAGNIRIRGQRIEAVGEIGPAAGEDHDLEGLAVAPGFIDAHTHDDRLLLSDPDMRPKVSQGVTTVVGGNCGISLAPLTGTDPPPPLNLLGDRDWFRFSTMADYRRALEAGGMAANCAMLVGHSTLRAGTLDDLEKPATEAETGIMAARVEEAMDAGCIGLSTGLAYPTASAATTGEVTTLCRTVAERGGLHATHMRDEGDRLVEAVDETIAIARDSGVETVISHHKAIHDRNWGKTRLSLQRIEAARDHCRIHFDVYPYAASSTVLLPEFVEKAETTRVTWSTPCPHMAGRFLDDICREWDCDVAAAVERLHPAGAVYFEISEEELRSLLARPDTLVGSDGLPHDPLPHPRLWGTFPRVLGHYARDLGLMPLEQAIHQMSGLTAAVFGLGDRGVIAPGKFADLVIFDPATVGDNATFDDPVQASAGIERVMVNGEWSWRNGDITGARAGRWLSRVP